MSNVVAVKNIEIFIVAVTTKTNWIFLRMTSFDGVEGLGEASLAGRESEVTDVFLAAKDNLVGKSFDVDSVETQLEFDSLPKAAYSSAVMQCFCDIVARSQGISLAESLGCLLYTSPSPRD